MLTWRGKTRMYTVGIVFEFYTVPLQINFIRVINAELEKIHVWFSANRLSLNVAKTNYMFFGKRKVTVDISIKMNVTIRALVRMRMRFSVNEDRTPLNFIAVYWFGLTDENPVSSSQFTAVSLSRSGCRRKRKVMDNRRNSTTTILLVVSAPTEVSPAQSPDASSIPLPRERA